MFLRFCLTLKWELKLDSFLGSSPSTYFEYDGSSRFLLQNTRKAEGLQVRVGVVDKACVVIGEQSLDIVEDKSKLIHMFHCLMVCGVLHLQRWSEAADGGCVQNFAHLEKNQIRFFKLHHIIHNLTM